MYPLIMPDVCASRLANSFDVCFGFFRNI